MQTVSVVQVDTVRDSVAVSALMLGDEFLMPLQAFFCSLCCEFSKDSTSAEAHLKSREHNNKFKVWNCYVLRQALVLLDVVVAFSVFSLVLLLPWCSVTFVS